MSLLIFHCSAWNWKYETIARRFRDFKKYFMPRYSLRWHQPDTAQASSRNSVVGHTSPTHQVTRQESSRPGTSSGPHHSNPTQYSLRSFLVKDTSGKSMNVNSVIINYFLGANMDWSRIVCWSWSRDRASGMNGCYINISDGSWLKKIVPSAQSEAGDGIKVHPHSRLGCHPCGPVVFGWMQCWLFLGWDWVEVAGMFTILHSVQETACTSSIKYNWSVKCNNRYMDYV